MYQAPSPTKLGGVRDLLEQRDRSPEGHGGRPLLRRTERSALAYPTRPVGAGRPPVASDAEGAAWSLDALVARIASLSEVAGLREGRGNTPPWRAPGGHVLQGPEQCGLSAWEKAGIAYGYWETSNQGPSTLMGVHLPHATEAVHWLAQRRAWASRPRLAPRAPMPSDVALTVICAALDAASYPPPICTRTEAADYLALSRPQRRLELTAGRRP